MKVIIVGPAKSGKTTLAEKLASVQASRDAGNAAIIFDGHWRAEYGAPTCENWIICAQYQSEIHSTVKEQADEVIDLSLGWRAGAARTAYI